MSDMILLYQTVFIPRLLYNCESWSDLSSENYAMLQEITTDFPEESNGTPQIITC